MCFFILMLLSVRRRSPRNLGALRSGEASGRPLWLDRLRIRGLFDVFPGDSMQWPRRMDPTGPGKPSVYTRNYCSPVQR